MGKNVKVNLTIDEDVVKEAKEIGLNLSKISENALKEAISALKRSKTETNGGNAINTVTEYNDQEREEYALHSRSLRFLRRHGQGESHLLSLVEGQNRCSCKGWSWSQRGSYGGLQRQGIQNADVAKRFCLR